jgi:ribonuclease VapC
MKVFDSSAVLALIFDEPGADLAARLMDEHQALISSVNQAEVLGKLFDRGLSADDVTTIRQQLPLTVMPFTSDQALLAAGLRPATRALGLSLGDRCCLALAQQQGGAAVVTADRPWAGLAGFDITLIR